MLRNSNNNSKSLGYWMVVNGSELWTNDGSIPFGSAQELQLSHKDAHQIGNLNSHPVYWLDDAKVEQDLPMTSLRDLLIGDEAVFLLASKAVQYGHMTQSLRFCPICGGKTFLNHNQLAMQCGDCRTLHYPRIFPCIIVAIHNESQILLAQHNRHKGDMYTVIAGFVEVGETLEQCVAREVKEETGIEVKNIRYQGSQPWAFPSSLMVAYIAEYAGGEIKVDKSELKDVQWFDMDKLPSVAPHGTIARKLIEQVGIELDSEQKKPS
jgi:NAD+ diphosphatase